MWDLRGNQLITGTPTIFWPFPFLHFCSSILFHSQQFLRGAGRLGGALSGVYSSWTAQPLQAPCSEAHPRVTCSSQACHHALPGISVAYFGVFLFSGHQMHPPPPALDFFSASALTDVSLAAISALYSPLYFKLHGDSLSPNVL